MLKRAILLSFLVIAVTAQTSFASDADKCGPKPYAKAGCHIGDCVAGKWEMICDIKPTEDCGAKPTPKENCQIGKCINKHWEEICTNGGGDMAH